MGGEKIGSTPVMPSLGAEELCSFLSAGDGVAAFCAPPLERRLMLGQLSWRVEQFNKKPLESTVAGPEKNHWVGRQEEEEVDGTSILAL